MLEPYGVRERRLTACLVSNASRFGSIVPKPEYAGDYDNMQHAALNVVGPPMYSHVCMGVARATVSSCA